MAYLETSYDRPVKISNFAINYYTIQYHMQDEIVEHATILDMDDPEDQGASIKYPIHAAYPTGNEKIDLYVSKNDENQILNSLDSLVGEFKARKREEKIERILTKLIHQS